VVLDAHLSTEVDPSYAVRAVYGQWYPWLILLDSEWAGSRAGLVFPTNKESASYFRASWGAYIVYTRPYSNVLPTLSGAYSHAISLLPGDATLVGFSERPADHLGQHLMEYYWRGDLDLADAGLISSFFDAASEEQRGHALSWVGRMLHQSEESPSGEVVQRLKLLWDWRANVAEVSRAELQAFGWWFGSGEFDDEWSIPRVVAVLSRGILPEPDHLVIERFAHIAEESPSPAVSALERMIELAEKGWEIHGWLDGAKSILQAGLRSKDTETCERAERIVHRLGELRFRDFRELLKGLSRPARAIPAPNPSATDER
jgi:hypothetical protein